MYHHPGNLNFSLYLPLQGAWTDVRRSQALLSGRLAHALRARWGLAARERDGGVFVDGQKVSGSAQLRRRALLHHGTLLIWEDELDMRLLLRAMRPGYCPGPVPSRPAPTADLSTLVGSPVAMGEGREVLVSAYGELRIRCTRQEWTLSDKWTGSPLSAT